MTTTIEHINITVPDIDATIRFLKIIAPDLMIRMDKTSAKNRWVHLANDQMYFALQAPHLGSEPQAPRTPYINYGVNHIGLVVTNLDQIEKQLIKHVYQTSIETPSRLLKFYLDGTILR